MRRSERRHAGCVAAKALGIGRLMAILGLTVVWPAGVSRAQVSSPNPEGVAMGHLHYHVGNVEAHKKFWATLGAKPIKVGTTDVMKLSDVLIFLTPGAAYGGIAESVVNHVGFKVPNLSQTLSTLTAAGWKVTDVQYRTLTQAEMAKLTAAYTYTPERDKVELFQELTEDARFTRDGPGDFKTERLNQKMTGPIATHHIHLYVREGLDLEARDWYVKLFGAVPGTRNTRLRYIAADLPGMNLNFLAVPNGVAPGISFFAGTKGRTLDHVGFEIKNLEAFCRKLEASGVRFEVPYHKDREGFASAFFFDPWGTYIELTEGLSGF